MTYCNIVKSNYILAKKLRDKENLELIPKECPGYYKWWCQKLDFERILRKLQLDFDVIKDCLETKEFDGVYYCVYVGIAVNESVRARLNWHINEMNSEKNVRNGYLSTLRQSLASLFGKDMLDTQATNEFIDCMIVEYFLSDKKIRSTEAKSEISTIEKSMLSSDKLYVLNIRDNKHPLAPKKLLKALRKKAKIFQ